MLLPSRPIVTTGAPSLRDHHPPLGFSAPVVPGDGFKFSVNAEVEYFIPDEDLYWSFGWLRGTIDPEASSYYFELTIELVRIISRGKKQVGSKLLPHYLVEHAVRRELSCPFSGTFAIFRSTLFFTGRR